MPAEPQSQQAGVGLGIDGAAISGVTVKLRPDVAGIGLTIQNGANHSSRHSQPRRFSTAGSSREPHPAGAGWVLAPISLSLASRYESARRSRGPLIFAQMREPGRIRCGRRSVSSGDCGREGDARHRGGRVRASRTAELACVERRLRRGSGLCRVEPGAETPRGVTNARAAAFLICLRVWPIALPRCWSSESVRVRSPPRSSSPPISPVPRVRSAVATSSRLSYVRLA